VTEELESRYPKKWETDVVVSDGGTVYIRPIKPTDSNGIESFYARLSPETIYLRFFTPLPRLSDAMLHRFVNVDYVDRMAFIALLGDAIIAVARYDRIPGSDAAEVAFLVDDAHQGRGLGTIMLEYLAAVAKESGVARFLADTLPENSKMLRVFHDAGFHDQKSFQDGVVRVTFTIATTKESAEAMYRREQAAVSASVAKLLAPRSVAVVGASRVPGSVGHLLFRNILDSNYQGISYPVNPSAHAIASVKAYPTLQAIPDSIDLAIIAVAAENVEAIVRDAAEKQVGAVVIISAGFSELSDSGRELERRVIRIARRNGMRVVGPSSMGVASMVPSVSLNATLSPLPPSMGKAALHAQSGALSLAILEEARRRGLGISHFVSSGNKADISGNDLLHYWENDPTTSVIMLYIEDFGNPRTFARVARRVSLSKPIIAVKSKRSAALESSLTLSERDNEELASLLPNHLAVDALFAHTGVVRVDTLEQLFEQANAMVSQPLPLGPRTAILSNIGGPAPLCADACRAVGLQVEPLPESTQRTLSLSLPPDCKVVNPVELSASAVPVDFERSLRTLLETPEIDAVIVLYIPTVVGSPESPSTLMRPMAGGRLRGTPELANATAAEVAVAISRAATQDDPSSTPKPVLANFLSLPGVEPALSSSPRTIPLFAFPEAAAMALGRMYDYQRWRSRPNTEYTAQTSTEPGQVHEIITETLLRTQHPQSSSSQTIAADEDRRAHISEGDALRLCTLYGLPVADNEAIAHARTIEPFALLRIDLTHDLTFGPFLELRLSGEVAELIGTRAIRALPRSKDDVVDLIRSMPGSRLLYGYRDLPPLDEEALSEVVLKLVAIADEIFELAHLRIDPVLLRPNGCLLSAPEITVANWSRSAILSTRALRTI
jgi:acyl-CoA synthetase (NDP forming)/RimJ/RimL family protein N-acetyltransferase